MRYYLTASALLIGILGYSPLRARGLDCPHGSAPWFNFTLEVDSASLPVGVIAKSTVDYSGNTVVNLKNSTNIPLLINPPDPHKKYLEPYPRPLTMKFVSGEAYYCDVMAKPMKCEMNANVNKETVPFDTPEISKAVYEGQVEEDDRPADVNIPEPKPFHSIAVYGDKHFIISGAVFFSLNFNYDPKFGVKSKKLCDDIES
ncbi:MAG: hypothetical protein ACR65O_05825 [Methylomicrobium sp.]